MSSNLLTDEAQNENATTLAAALGLSHADAAQALDISILLTADPADSVALQVTSHIETLLKRTVHYISSSAGTHGNCTVEVIVGSALPKTSGSKLYVKIREDLALISQEALSEESCVSIHPILLLLTAEWTSLLPWTQNTPSSKQRLPRADTPVVELSIRDSISQPANKFNS